MGQDFSYDSRESLVEAMTRMQQDDTERRRRAEIGHRLAHERTSHTVVADAMLDAVMGRARSHGYHWQIEPLA